MLLVPASLYVFSWVHRVAPGVVAADLMRAFSITAAALGNLAAIYPYVFAAMALVAGSLADTLGPRWTIALGGAAMGGGAVVFGLAPSFDVAFAGRLCVGLGASVMLIAWLALASAWFRPDEFATISGFPQTVGHVGAFAAASPLALLMEAVGWRPAFRLIGGAPVAGWLSDRWLGRRRLPMLVLAALYAACWAPLVLPGELRVPVALLAPFFLLMGFASSGLVLVWSCVREVNNPALVGVAVGFCNLPIFLGFALLQWLTGVILDAKWTGLMAGGARLYPPAAFQAGVSLCLGPRPGRGAPPAPPPPRRRP